MKIILFALNSSYTHTNLAVRYLKSVLDCAGTETHIIERNLKDKRDAVLYDLYAGSADVYGFSAYIWNINEMYRYAAALKILRPDCKIVFGGPEVSFADEELINNHRYIDYIIRGEGEDAFVNLVKNGSDKRIIDGTGFENFTQTGNMYTTVPRGSIIYYESSRGCPYNCAFCLSSLTEGIRAKTAETVLSDLLEFENFTEDIKIVKFVDRTFNFDRERSKTIWRALAGDEYSLKYHFEICADLLDDESIDLLSKMPQDKMQFEIGVQSTNPATLEACMRRSNISLVLENTRRLHNNGNIHIHCDLIAGLPYESYDRFAVSYDQVHSCCDFLQLGFLKLLHGSCLREHSDRYGIVYNPEPPYTILYNNYISYEELYRLGRIVSISERFEKTSNKNTMNFIFKNVNSPFKFYEGIAEVYKSDLSSLSQYKARELLFSYAKNLVDPLLLSAYMRFDWLLYETGKCPPYLRGGVNKERMLIKSKNEFIAEYKSNHPSERVPSVEAHIFEFDRSNVYLIDRVNHVYYIRDAT
ncbi:MAG: DUF4080 domain-containing protein [Eubacteriales bacterium]|jgi:hypothetical protein|nr:DUF4080 domain-containing protein [Eubacteriales bacterium]